MIRGKGEKIEMGGNKGKDRSKEANWEHNSEHCDTFFFFFCFFLAVFCACVQRGEGVCVFSIFFRVFSHYQKKKETISRETSFCIRKPRCGEEKNRDRSYLFFSPPFFGKKGGGVGR